MAYTNKLDTNVITISVTAPDTINYTPTQGTINLDQVISYNTYVNPDGTVSTFCLLIMVGQQVIVDETYATIDALINP